ncbi:hypothetical protein HY090_02485 [Candidatus Kaiserbacteria bacterium]|nr:hypothetical protein [Candidatus Kaiserbacteria bacterium]
MSKYEAAGEDTQRLAATSSVGVLLGLKGIGGKGHGGAGAVFELFRTKDEDEQ